MVSLSFKFFGDKTTLIIKIIPVIHKTLSHYRWKIQTSLHEIPPCTALYLLCVTQLKK